jgi:hypothetical protein
MFMAVKVLNTTLLAGVEEVLVRGSTPPHLK